VPAWRQIVSNQLSYHSTGYSVAVKPHANAELFSQGINWLDTYDVAHGDHLCHFQKDFQYSAKWWLKPEGVAEIEFLEWTGGDRLRHSKFVGLRDDQDATTVVKEQLDDAQK
jgi:ATP dependent DNA ligase C terminal region